MNLQDRIENDIRRINQSKIKRVKNLATCPQRYFMEEISGDIERKASEAMLKGQYMEYQLWNTLPKEGGIPVLKGGRKKGSISEPQKRIDEQIANFPYIMAKHGIKIIKTNYQIESLHSGIIVYHGTLDALVEYKGRPYIMDLKLTADVNSSFGDFAWGEFVVDENRYCLARWNENSDGMDLIQGHSYSTFLEKLTKTKWGFIYAVFDYKASGPEYKIIEVPITDEARNQVFKRLEETREKLVTFRDINYIPIPSEKECKACKYLDCTHRIIPDPNGKDSELDNFHFPVQAKTNLQPVVVSADEDSPW